MTPMKGLLAVAMGCVLGGVACSGTHFQVDVPASFHAAPPTISIVGVYHDGRFSPDTWPDLAPAVQGAIGRGCELGYAEALQTADPALYEELDGDVRRDGVTDEIIGRFAPAATGDVLMVLHFYSPIAPTTKTTTGSGAPALTAPHSSYSSRGSAGTMGRPLVNGTEPPLDRDRANVEIAAILYSKKDHAAVGQVVLTYEGRDANAAIRTFGERLATELHGAKCAGWSWPARPAASSDAQPPAAAPPTPAPSDARPPAAAPPAAP